MSTRLPEIHQVVGVDFSGARQSGLTAWMARTEVDLRTGGGAPDLPRLRLSSLDPLSELTNGEHRDLVNRYLVDQVLRSEQTLWGFDFPFGLPVELGLGTWRQQLRQVGNFVGDAREYGRFLVGRSLELTGAMHVRRLTDSETKTPFDCYHYRIIHQTFHGMRDVLRRIAPDRQTSILPFQFSRLRGESSRPRRIVVEACPSSTLKRLGLPHRLYKQIGGQPPTDAQREVRSQILRGLQQRIELTARQRQLMMENSGADALDAVVAAVGVWETWQRDDPAAIARHPRYRREGRVYA